MLIMGDARHIPLKSESVQMVCTSPPYWGLRQYDSARWKGGDAECDHKGPPMRTNNKPTNHAASFHGGTTRANEFYRSECGKCGAKRIDAQIGLEESPELYVATMVQVFREVWRVLKPSGVAWIVISDSYNSHPGQRKVTDNAGTKQRSNGGSIGAASRHVPELKPKDLVGIPWAVAFALRADGWYLRSEIIYSKPNPMPESVTDRVTRSHEQVFMLTKQQRYYYNQEAIMEPQSEGTIERFGLNPKKSPSKKYASNDGFVNTVGGATIRANGMRNKRSVWEIASAPFSGSHFATFPPKLIEPMILAGSRPGDVVLDPFCGTGTTQLVAKEFGRIGIGIDLSYQSLASERIAGGPLLAGTVNAEPIELSLASNRESVRAQKQLPTENSQYNRSEYCNRDDE